MSKANNQKESSDKPGRIGSARKRSIRIRCLQEQDNKCLYCSTPIRYDTATLEHRVPQCDGGTFNMDNIAVACVDCNMAKGNMSEADFRSKPRKTKADK